MTIYRINSNHHGFEQLIGLHHQLISTSDSTFELDLSKTQWFDANMCAVLGAVLVFAQKNKRLKISINRTIQKGVEDIMQKNGFLCHYGWDEEPDIYDTVFKFECFESNETGRFSEYIEKYFVKGGRGLPKMSSQLLGRFRVSIYEIFENAREHADSKHGVFVCGQYFPKNKRIAFSIVDLGIGFQKKIRNSLNLKLKPNEAIDWALSECNTTRDPSAGKPGGIGLKLIREFIEKNNGRLIIVSDAGYWELTEKGKIEMRQFEFPFPGTAVTFEIDTSDTKEYYLEGEDPDIDSIF